MNIGLVVTVTAALTFAASSWVFTLILNKVVTRAWEKVKASHEVVVPCSEPGKQKAWYGLKCPCGKLISARLNKTPDINFSNATSICCGIPFEEWIEIEGASPRITEG